MVQHLDLLGCPRLTELVVHIVAIPGADIPELATRHVDRGAISDLHQDFANLILEAFGAATFFELTGTFVFLRVNDASHAELERMSTTNVWNVRTQLSHYLEVNPVVAIEIVQNAP